MSEGQRNGRLAAAQAAARPQPAGHLFQAFASKASNAAGTKWAFIAAMLAIVVWLLFGPIFRYSDTWQLVINTATTIVTFLMVFLIQNTQNRDARALHLKLDELIHAIKTAKNEMIDIEKLPEQELKDLSDKYEKMRDECDETEVGAESEPRRSERSGQN